MESQWSHVFASTKISSQRFLQSVIFSYLSVDEPNQTIAKATMSTTSKALPTAPLTLRVGCVGGGQLGRMMALEAPRLNIDMKFLDGGGGSCPSAQVVGVTCGQQQQRIIEGKLYDEDKLRELSTGCDVVTIEIEHVGVEGLAKLENEGVNVQPGSRVVGIIQDKFVQKVCYCWMIYSFGLLIYVGK